MTTQYTVLDDNYTASLLEVEGPRQPETALLARRLESVPLTQIQYELIKAIASGREFTREEASLYQQAKTACKRLNDPSSFCRAAVGPQRGTRGGRK